jgi:hypothetical protein
MINSNTLTGKTREVLRSGVFGLVMACFVGLASQASAVTLTSSSGEFLGVIVTGEPSSTDQEVIYINDLVGLAPNGTATIDTGAGGSNEPHNFTRSGNTLCYSTCPSATATGASSSGSNPSATGIDVTGFTYLLAKYDGPNGGDLVWYVAGLSGAIDITPDLAGNPICTTGSCGLSHYELFNSTGHATPSVPEPSAFFLLGFGLLTLRIMSKKHG